MTDLSRPGNPGRIGVQVDSKEMRRAVRNAREFRPNERMEDLLEIREQDPQKFGAMAASVQIAVGLYESDRATYEQVLGFDPAALEGDS